MKRRLLILSCSLRKNNTDELLPAIDRYNGPLFLVLRRFLRECPLRARLLDVYILSAVYGLIPGDFATVWYDRKMDKTRAVELQPQVIKVFSILLRDDYDSVLFVLGKTYMDVFEDLLYLLPAQMESNVAIGAIGRKQSQLKDWLWEIPVL